jgi:hypothetical protein
MAAIARVESPFTNVPVAIILWAAKAFYPSSFKSPSCWPFILPCNTFALAGKILNSFIFIFYSSAFLAAHDKIIVLVGWQGAAPPSEKKIFPLLYLEDLKVHRHYAINTESRLLPAGVLPGFFSTAVNNS